MIEADRILASIVAPTRNFHDGEIVMISEREERHFQAVAIKMCANWKSENAVIEFFGAFAIAYPHDHMTERQYLHSSHHCADPKTFYHLWVTDNTAVPLG